MEFADGLSRSKALSDELTAKLHSLSQELQLKNTEMTKAKIEVNNLNLLTSQLKTSLHLATSENNSFKAKADSLQNQS